MILVNVFFAEMNRSYDFHVEISATVGQLVTDMVNQIASREHLVLDRDPGTFILCRRFTNEIFGGEATLLTYDIHSGDELMLV